MADITHLTDLVKSLIEEVKTLRVENKQLHEEVKCIREEMKTKKRSTPKPTTKPKVQCSATAATSGNRCKRCALDGKDVCAMHDRPTSSNTVREPKPNRKPKVKKVKQKKLVPEHNHPIGESPIEGVVCELCENHGDIFDPDTADADFEVCEENGQSIEERLRIMLESEGE